MKAGARVLLCAFGFMFAAWTSACASAPLPPIENEALVYQTSPGPFCGRCDTTKITVTTEGVVWVEQGHWAGNYRNWRVARRSLDVSPTALMRFDEALNRFRPADDLTLAESCDEFWSDQPEIHITWYDGGQQRRLIYNFGCDPQARREMRDALVSAPQLLDVPNLRMPEFGS